MSNVYAAISKVMAIMSKEGISKDRKNKEQGFAFRGIDDVMNALSAHMAEAGLVVLPSVKQRIVTERTTKSGTVMFNIACEVAFDFVAQDGSKHTVTTWGEAQDSGDKATNKAMSAALKYACLQTFMIPTEGDNDADAHTPETTVRRLDEKVIADELAAIEAAADMEGLQAAFKAAYQIATSGGDADALKQFTAAKDKRKAALSGNGSTTTH